MSNSKIKISGLVFAISIMIIIIGFILFRQEEITKPPIWSTETKIYSIPAISINRVAEESSNLTIFYFKDDATVQPVNVEKISEDEWRVTFKKRPN
jgi:hypothetical protein